MLDEIDKVSVGVQGDPAAALLEVLDPAQNHAFRDHYLEVPINLSNVLFIATANQLGTIHPALLDRMEIIQLSSYTEEEKVHIAKMYLVPRQREEHGLKPEQLIIDDARAAARDLASTRARRASARSSGRSRALARKVAAKVATEAGYVGRVTAKDVPDYLGPPRYRPDGAFRLSRPGVATGLAWTEVGGDVLYIEAVLLPGGSGHLTLTGQLGNVMQESARAALSHVRQMSAVAGPRARDADQARHPHPRARRRHPQGRPVGGRDDGHRDRLRRARRAGPRGRRHDGRDHAVGTGAARSAASARRRWPREATASGR